MQGRIAFSIFLIVVGFFLPWWAVIPLILLGSYWYAPWFEVLAIGLLFDLVFGMDRTLFYGVEVAYSLIALVSLGLMYFIRKKFINV